MPSRGHTPDANFLRVDIQFDSMGSNPSNGLLAIGDLRREDGFLTHSVADGNAHESGLRDGPKRGIRLVFPSDAPGATVNKQHGKGKFGWSILRSIYIEF